LHTSRSQVNRLLDPAYVIAHSRYDRSKNPPCKERKKGASSSVVEGRDIVS
jgi:hypothetical protein